MKKTILIGILTLQAVGMQAQDDAKKAAEQAAKALLEAKPIETVQAKPSYWTNSLKTNINFGQTSLTNWAAGGDNTYSLIGYFDGSANFKKNDLFWNNRLQLDYGFVYSSSKPILQKSNDRIYLESKFGYQVKKNLYLSANFDFKSQFSRGYLYKTPGTEILEKYGAKSLDELSKSDQVKAWKEARLAQSDFLSPAYTNLALGIDYEPTKWLSVNIAPVTGGFVIVMDPAFRKAYSMPLKSDYESLQTELEAMPDKTSSEYLIGKAKLDEAIGDGSAYRSSRFEFGAQIKTDIALKINDNINYNTQLVLFSNYLDNPQNIRVNWDNRFEWKVAKFINLVLVTNLIYDDTVMIKTADDIAEFPDGKQRVQFKESLSIGFSYTIASK